MRTICVLAATPVLAGCASRSGDIAEAYVSPLQTCRGQRSAGTHSTVSWAGTRGCRRFVMPDICYLILSSGRAQ
jgi:hypothetical protein